MKSIKHSVIRTVFGLVMALTPPTPLVASDHDDGESDLKGRALNLTDLYVFREDWQSKSGSAENMVFVMNTNPRSVARQQYSFSSQALYEFHISRVSAAAKVLKPTGADNVRLSFQFGVPKADGKQDIFLTMNGVNSSPNKLARALNRRRILVGTTTTLADAQKNVVLSNSPVGGGGISVFAGLREDPFYFDVERYFRIRGLLATGVNTLGSGPTQSGPNGAGPNVFRSDATAVDFAAGYNVNSIAIKIPISFLQTTKLEPVFDVWETISIPARRSTCRFLPAFICSGLSHFRDSFRQVERLARPAINEGLVLSNDSLNAFNAIAPHLDLSKGATPVLSEAGAVLTAVFKYAAGAGVGLNPAPVADVVAGFLPDVMRVDSSKKVEIGSWAYNSDAVLVKDTKAAMLTGGRKIEDDVMDITLSYLINGNPFCGPNKPCDIQDGVSYAGGTKLCSEAGLGSNPSNPGHKCLTGQEVRDGGAEFPYLASPN